MSVLHSRPYKQHRMFDTAKVRYFWIGRRKMLEFIISFQPIFARQNAHGQLQWCTIAFRLAILSDN